MSALFNQSKLIITNKYPTFLNRGQMSFLTYFGVLFLLSNFVYSSDADIPEYNLSYIITDIDGINSLVTKKNDDLVNLLKDEDHWKNSLGNLTKDDPGMIAVFQNMQDLFCIGPEPCMIEFKRNDLVGHLKNKGPEEYYEVVRLIKNQIQRFRSYMENLTTSVFRADVFIRRISFVIQDFRTLLDIAEGTALRDEFEHCISFDELVVCLSDACLKLTKGRLTHDFYNTLRKALKVPQIGDPDPPKSGDENKGPNDKSTPLSLGMKILLFGVLPFILIVSAVIIVVFIIKRK